MVKTFHGKELPLKSVMGLIQQGAGHGHLGVCKDDIPAGFLGPKPLAYAVAVGRSCRGGDMVRKAA
jgi:hypothetical protein